MSKDSKVLEYSLMGVGGLLLSYVLFKSIKSAYGADKKGRTPRGSKSPTLEGISLDMLSDGKSKIPALFMTSEPFVDIEYSKLNFTPRRMSEVHDGRKYRDSEILKDPFRIPKEFENVANPNEMIHPNDYQILQNSGIIPQGFPISRTQYVRSYNGLNEFIVGYSEEISIETNRDDLNVIYPMWAVSFANNFVPNGNPPDSLEDKSLFYNLSERVLGAEWLLTNKGNDGCHKGQTLTMCDAERSALLGAILQRTWRKQERRSETIDYKAVIYGPGLRWNAGNSFMSAYRGYFGSETDAKSPLKDLPQVAKDRFKRFYYHAFWQMPTLTYKADHFIHPYSMSKKKDKNPQFIKETNPLPEDAESYAATHAILIGNSVFTDNRKNFI